MLKKSKLSILWVGQHIKLNVKIKVRCVRAVSYSLLCIKPSTPYNPYSTMVAPICTPALLDIMRKFKCSFGVQRLCSSEQHKDLTGQHYSISKRLDIEPSYILKFNQLDLQETLY